ncbi:MAG: OmpA family protein [Candidatus Scalindua rubra]|uniref:H+-driven flagellar motor component MotB n=1 Tax=Candidatus Scalindua brodae TaxID=237368 RepID=A0A0B0ENM0_9BACT|nr:MAG: H+-driven flagellar motor component MotB [Candidatus Scalindua brodae]MBZ0107223.1 OmpA family protein [Candidatus Scalindua rubra]TWU31662.1 flagellar motor protein MotS [Candidatus Brocadiaceae bacterium S225]
MAEINIQKILAVRKKKKKPVEDGAFVDMVAFAALMTILLAFFIMLSSNVGPVRDEEAKEAIESFIEALDNYGVSKIAFGSSDSITNLEMKQESYGGKHKKRNEMLKNVFANTIDSNIDVEYTQKGHQLVFPTEIDFINEELDMSSESKMYLNNLIKVIRNRDCQVVVGGYTSENFIPTDDYPTSWQLSAEFASAVIRYFNDVGKIDYSRLTAIGYGKHQPLLGNGSSFNTIVNNRINIIISDL